MTTDATEAQILIDWFADSAGFSMGTKAPHKWVLQAESELRRLAAENADLRAEVDKLRATLEFYADRADTGYQVEIINYGAEYILGKIIRLGGKPARAALEGKK